MNEDELADLLDQGAGPRARWGGRNDAQTRAAAAHVRALLGDEAVWAEPDPDGADTLLTVIRHEQAELDDLANGRGERRWVPRPAPRPAPFGATRAAAERDSGGPWAAVARLGEGLERRVGAARARVGLAVAVVAVLVLAALAGAALDGDGGDGAIAPPASEDAAPAGGVAAEGARPAG